MPDTDSSQDSPPIRSNRKLSPKDWLEIVNLARNGAKPTRIAAIYNVDHSGIYRGLRKRGVVLNDLAKEADEEQVERQREELIRKIKDTKENDYKQTEALQKMIVSTVLEAYKEKKIGSVLGDIKTLKLAIDGVRSGTINKWKILGLDKDESETDAALPELPIREMTQEEVIAIRNRQADEDGGLSADEMQAVEDMSNEIIDIEDEGDEEDSVGSW